MRARPVRFELYADQLRTRDSTRLHDAARRFVDSCLSCNTHPQAFAPAPRRADERVPTA